MSHNYSLAPSRYLAAAAIAPLCFSLVACSNDADTSAEPEFSDATAASSSAAETSSEETTSGPATSEAADTATETAAAEPTSAEAAPAEDTAVSANEESEAPAAAPAADTGRGDCSPEALQPAAPTMTNIRVNNCDGQWAHFGKDSTDWTAWARYEGGQWVAIESIGTTTSGLSVPCYDVDKWAAEGAPAFVTEKMRRCD